MLLGSIKPELLSFTQAEKDNRPYNTPLHVYELVASCRNAFTKDETESYISILASRFEEDCTISPESNSFDLHSIIEMGKVLAIFRFKQGKFDDVDRILNSTINSIEKSDTDGHARTSHRRALQGFNPACIEHGKAIRFG